MDHWKYPGFDTNLFAVNPSIPLNWYCQLYFQGHLSLWIDPVSQKLPCIWYQFQGVISFTPCNWNCHSEQYLHWYKFLRCHCICVLQLKMSAASTLALTLIFQLSILSSLQTDLVNHKHLGFDFDFSDVNPSPLGNWNSQPHSILLWHLYFKCQMICPLALILWAWFQLKVRCNNYCNYIQSKLHRRLNRTYNLRCS